MGPDVLNKSFFPDLIKHLLPSPVKLLTSALPNERGRAPALGGFNDGKRSKYNVLFHVVLPFCIFTAPPSFFPRVQISLSVFLKVCVSSALTLSLISLMN